MVQYSSKCVITQSYRSSCQLLVRKIECYLAYKKYVQEAFDFDISKHLNYSYTLRMTMGTRWLMNMYMSVKLALVAMEKW